MQTFEVLYTEPLAVNKRHKIVAFLLAFIATGLFFYTSLYSAKQPSYVFDGDAWHVNGAQFVYENYLLKHGIFSAIDMFTENGASEYYLRPNLPSYQPLFMLAAATLKVASPWSDSIPLNISLLYVINLAVAAFFSAYFLHQLGTRFFRFDDWLSAFVTIGYVFSVQCVHSFWCSPFPVISWMLPIVAYLGLSAARKRTLVGYLLASVPSVMAFMSGYIPIALVCMGMASLIIIWHEFDAYRAEPWQKRARTTFRALLPSLIGGLVSTPFYLATMRYHETVEIANIPGAHTLQVVAQTLYEAPRNIVNIFTNSSIFETQRYEFSLFWGLVPVLIFVLYLTSRNQQVSDPNSASEIPLRNPAFIIGVTLCAYFLLMLATFGPFSPVSDIMYYFVPVAGYMHIYQRFYVLFQLLLMLMLALMLNNVIAFNTYNRRPAKILLSFFSVATLVMAAMAGQPMTPGAISNGLIAELILASAFLVALVFGNRRIIITSATICMFLVSLTAIYSYTDNPNAYLSAKRTQTITFDAAAMNKLAEYFKKNSSKAIIKYVDLLPGPQPYVPKNLPWFMLNDVKLSSYYGYDWHLSTNYIYRQRMGIAQIAGEKELSFQPDWDWIRRTGADFVLYKENSPGTDPNLQAYLDRSDPTRVLHFAGAEGYVLAPLKFEPSNGEPVLFDNGYIRVQGSGKPAVSDFKTDNAGAMSFTITSQASTVISYLFWPNKHMTLAIDGATAAFKTYDSMATIELPAGTHKVSMGYSNLLLQLFLVIYTLYWLSILGAVFAVLINIVRRTSGQYTRYWHRKPKHP